MVPKNRLVYIFNIYQVLYHCKHGPSRRTQCKGLRPNVHTIKLNCGAFVRFRKRNSLFTLSKFSENHNHIVSEDWFKRDTGTINNEDEELFDTLINANCLPAQIKKCLQEDKNKVVTTRAIKYFMRKKNFKTSEKEQKNLDEFLSDLKEKGGEVNKLENPDGTVRVLTITTQAIKNSFQKARPSVIQVDTTHNIDSSGFKLSAVVYYHPVTGKGEVAQMAFIEDESKDVYSFLFQQLKTLVIDDPPIIIIDKDFTELKSLETVFPLSVILLCLFHVLKYWKSMVSTASVELSVKDKVLELMRSMLYAQIQNH